jgi:hypothetical protein
LNCVGYSGASGIACTASEEVTVTRCCGRECHSGDGAGFLALGDGQVRMISFVECLQIGETNSKSSAVLVAGDEEFTCESTNLTECLSMSATFITGNSDAIKIVVEFMCGFQSTGSLGLEATSVSYSNFFNNTFTASIIGANQGSAALTVCGCVFMHNEGQEIASANGVEITIVDCIFSGSESVYDSDSFTKNDNNWNTITSFLSIPLLGFRYCTFTPSSQFVISSGFGPSTFILSKKDHNFFRNGQRFVEVVNNNNSQSRLVI